MQRRRRPDPDALARAAEWLRANEGEGASLTQVAEWLEYLVAKLERENTVVDALVRLTGGDRKAARTWVRRNPGKAKQLLDEVNT